MNDNRCVCCGREIPEGEMVCQICKNKAMQMPLRNKKKPAKERHYTVTDSYLTKLVHTKAVEMLAKGINDFRDQELPMIREDVRKIVSLYEAVYRDVLGEMGLLTRDNVEEVLKNTEKRWTRIDELIMNGNMHELQKYANSIGADEDTFMTIMKRDGDPQAIAEIILEEDEL